MCDAVALGQIQNVVNQKVQSCVMFTAFDITVDVQQALKTSGQFDPAQHRHMHLKNDVHDVISQFVSSGQYDRRLQDVGAPSQAFVYYPAGGDPSAYIPQQRKNAVSPAPASPHVITIPTPKVDTPVLPTALVHPVLDSNNDGDGTDSGRKPDSRGTLCVSAFVLRSVGFNPFDSAYVWGELNQTGKYLVVSPKTPSDQAVNCTKYTVDHNCNVRITKAVLGFLDPATSFDFVAEPGDTVSVRAHK